MLLLLLLRLIVMAEDGVEIEPVEVGSLSINNGQRYTVLVCQPQGAPVSSEPVWIRATMKNE
jgi:FtsP/CotA-like multicopper oxidase with cupredoxin domain